MQVDQTGRVFAARAVLPTFAMESRLRRQQRLTAVALLLAAASLAFAIWSRVSPPSQLRFADDDEGVETIVDAWGVTSSGHSRSAKLDDSGLTHKSGNAAVGMPVYEASLSAMYGIQHVDSDHSVRLWHGGITANGGRGSLELTVAGAPHLAIRGNSSSRLWLDPRELSMSEGKLSASLLLDPKSPAAFLELAAPDAQVMAWAHPKTGELSVRAGNDSRSYGAK
jgi:hypothetical protein